jgi:hypothetical protein
MFCALTLGSRMRGETKEDRRSGSQDEERSFTDFDKLLLLSRADLAEGGSGLCVPFLLCIGTVSSVRTL